MYSAGGSGMLCPMKPQAARMISTLRATFRAMSLTSREVETRLGVSRGYLTRLFSGVMELRFDHVTDIAEAVGVDPDELFRLAFPQTQEEVSPATLKLRQALGAPESAPATVASEPSALEKEIERMVAKAVRKMFAQLNE